MSDIVLQITADVFDLPVECPSVSETSTLGAAMNAAVGLGYWSDYPAVVAGMTSVRKAVLPIPRNRDLYARLHDGVYRKMYGRMKPLFKELAGIARDFPEITRDGLDQE